MKGKTMINKTYQLRNKYNNVIVFGFPYPRAAFEHLKKAYEITFSDKTFIEYLDEWQLVEINDFGKYTNTYTQNL
jgi:hypothetical protein